MKRSAIWLVPLLILFSCLLASCNGAKATPTAEAPTTVLTFFGATGPQYLTLNDLKALPATEGMGGIVSSTGQITLPELYKGVALKDLVAAFGGTFDASMGITLTAQDGYSMTYSYAQVMDGDFPAYDPANGSELKQHDPLTAILAYERDGQPLDPIQDGVLRLVVVSERNNQITDGHWSIKWVNKAQVDTVGETWTLDLEGAMISPVSRASFQSCASPGCHGMEWKDENGQTWEGVPLYLLVGQVDDEDSHSDYAYNETLADAGYTVDLVGSDGYTVTLDSVSIKLNGNIIVAYLVNGSELPDKYYPLRLVGTGLQNSQMVGQIVKIVVHVPSAPTPTPAPAVEVTGDLVVTGLVNQPIGLMDADMHASDEVITISAEHPKNGMREFTGLRFKCLFNMAGGLNPDATKVVLTASDGYVTEINLADLQACENCMIAFSDTPGVYNAVMPGFNSSDWAKNVVKIEVK
jgi:DMSO/TMAO reductase YedYZ molybdopterin-dependent catalytic subunit